MLEEWLNANKNEKIYWIDYKNKAEKEKWSNMNSENEFLFANTGFNHLIKMSPIVWDVTKVKDITNHEVWENSILIKSKFKLDEVLNHFRSMLTAIHDGNKVHFRFYDGEVIHKMFNSFNEIEKKEFLGNSSSIAIYSKKGTITFNKEVTDYQYKDHTWWKIKDKHLSKLYCVDRHARNIRTACRQWMPELIIKIDEPTFEIKKYLNEGIEIELDVKNREAYLFSKLINDDTDSETLVEKLMLDNEYVKLINKWRLNPNAF